jgi:hypothetical protein
MQRIGDRRYDISRALARSNTDTLSPTSEGIVAQQGMNFGLGETIQSF